MLNLLTNGIISGGSNTIFSSQTYNVANKCPSGSGYANSCSPCEANDDGDIYLNCVCGNGSGGYTDTQLDLSKSSRSFP